MNRSTTVIILAALALLLSGCRFGRRADRIPLVKSEHNGEAVHIPASVEDYDAFIEEYFTADNASRLFYAMLASNPKETFDHCFSVRRNDMDIYQLAPDYDSRLLLYSLELDGATDDSFIQYVDGYEYAIKTSRYNPWNEASREVIENDSPVTGSIDAAYELYDEDDNLIFLVVSKMEPMPGSVDYTVVALQFKDGRPVKKPLFRSGDKRFLNISTSLSYSPATGDGEIDYAYRYDYDTRNLHIPHIDRDGDFNGKFLIYHFDGKDLVYQGTRGHDRLYAPLRSFKRHVANYLTDRFTVRVDEMPDGTYRYASWSDEKEQSEEPDLILYDGKSDGNVIRFRNESYTYVVPARPDRGDGMIDVYRGADLIVSEEVK